MYVITTKLECDVCGSEMIEWEPGELVCPDCTVLVLTGRPRPDNAHEKAA